MGIKIKTIAIGLAKDYKRKEEDFQSAYKKDTFFDSIAVDKLGLVGDIQVDKRFHGGEDKAIHIGSYKHIEDNPEFDKLFIGCNILVNEVDENNICIGDIYKMGEVVVQVTQPRQPCWKIGVIFGKEENKYIVRNNATGWYVRVLKEGKINVDDEMILENRVSNITIKELSKYLSIPPIDKKIIDEILNSDFIANAYKEDFSKKLK
jgi:MOSC domain-containing protein YiiM